MPKKQKLINRIIELKIFQAPINLSKRIILPGFDKLPLYNVAEIFYNGITNGAITLRASSMAFSFFLAIFPALLFFFTIIPYVPIDNFQEQLLEMLKEIIPTNVYDTVRITVEDIVNRPRGGLLSVGFVLTLYFSTNGVNSIIEAFNQTAHSLETRTWFRQRLIAILLVLIMAFIVIIAITLINFGTLTLHYLVENGLMKHNITFYLIQIGKWIVTIAMIFFGMSFLYYLGPIKKERFRFISAGSTFATFLTIALSLGFNFYVTNFARYNALYGSIGTLIIVLIMLYFNAIVLLIGFELNASIARAGIKRNIDNIT